MKVQCPCGAKFDFQVRPEMLAIPQRFVCASCGQDWSDYINGLIRQELIGGAAAISQAAAIVSAAEKAREAAPPPEPVAVPQPPAPAPAPRMRLQKAEPPPSESAEPDVTPRFCIKHPGQRPVEQCVVCGKALCPKCMELFGYLCSPLCRQKADLQGIHVPEFAGKKSVAERRQSRKAGLVFATAAVLVVVLLGAWFWYAWFGSVPRATFSVRFAEPSYSGKSFICDGSQIVFLHGDTLARHDMKAKREIWSHDLVDKKAIDAEVEQLIKRMRARQVELDNKNPDADPIKIPPADKLAKQMTRAAAGQLQLQVRGKNIWVASPEKLTRYDWDTGKPTQEISLSDSAGGLLTRGDEVVMLGRNDSGGRAVIHISLVTGQKRLEPMIDPAKTPAIAGASTKGTKPGDATMAVSNKNLDPDRLAEQARNTAFPGRIALPATLSIARNQEQAMAELRGDNDKPRAPAVPKPDVTDHFRLVPDGEGFTEFAVNLLEEKVTARSAMKPRPKKSALEGTVNAAATADIANEILNDMKRDAGGDVVYEDESRYAVAVRLPCDKNAPEWHGEVVGEPALHPLKTVNAIAAGKTIVVLDKTNKKKWEATLAYPVSRGGSDEEEGSVGLGPCVERGETLYIFDQGVLSAFDVASGNARWRLPSIGIAGMFFDDEGMIYLNTTSASPDKLKYSKQIDINDTTSAVVMKLDPKTGKTLWNSEVGGLISHLSGKFIYTVQSYQPDTSDEENPYMPSTGLERLPQMRIKRINPKNGKVMWTHFQERAPLDVHFDRNTIQLVFKKEVQVLKFVSF